MAPASALNSITDPPTTLSFPSTFSVNNKISIVWPDKPAAKISTVKFCEGAVKILLSKMID